MTNPCLIFYHPTLGIQTSDQVQKRSFSDFRVFYYGWVDTAPPFSSSLPHGTKLSVFGKKEKNERLE